GTWPAKPRFKGLFNQWETCKVQCTSNVNRRPCRCGAGCPPISPTHYLYEGARPPTFVDCGVIRETLNKDPAEHIYGIYVALSLEPAVTSPPEGEELVHRYHQTPEGDRPQICVPTCCPSRYRVLGAEADLYGINTV
ncbi:hypothetical protein PAXRUDRAFT_536331, partial [Paxillus rubicundulus Ve08.2h10]